MTICSPRSRHGGIGSGWERGGRLPRIWRRRERKRGAGVRLEREMEGGHQLGGPGRATSDKSKNRVDEQGRREDWA